MTDNTPARPEMPHSGVISLEEGGFLYAYTQADIDAIRADERRKALREARQIIHDAPDKHAAYWRINELILQEPT